jgi:hypothetical protein
MPAPGDQRIGLETFAMSGFRPALTTTKRLAAKSVAVMPAASALKG